MERQRERERERESEVREWRAVIIIERKKRGQQAFDR